MPPAERESPQSPLLQNLIRHRDELSRRGVRIHDRVVERLPNADNIMVLDGRPVTIWDSSGYTGVQNDPRVIEAAREALDTYGNQTTMSRFVGGNLFIYEQLERALADFKGTDASVIFATGLLANVCAISGILNVDRYMEHFYEAQSTSKEKVIFGDRLNHRSIQMGAILSRVEQKRYPHNDMKALQILMEQYTSDHPDGHMLVVTDGVFSLDGDMVQLPQLVALAKTYGATIYIDEAHATGVYGANGRGTAEHFGLTKLPDVIQMGTLSKAFGVIGGFVAGQQDVVDMIAFVSDDKFTSSLTPPEAAALIAAVDIVKHEPKLRMQLWKNVHQIINGLRTIGLEFPLQWSPIIPIMIRDEQKAVEIEEYLLTRWGVYCSAVRPPGVLAEESRLRIIANANHSPEQIVTLLEAMEDIKTAFTLPGQRVTPDMWTEFMNGTPSYIADFIHAPD